MSRFRGTGPLKDPASLVRTQWEAKECYKMIESPFLSRVAHHCYEL